VRLHGAIPHRNVTAPNQHPRQRHPGSAHGARGLGPTCAEGVSAPVARCCAAGAEAWPGWCERAFDAAAALRPYQLNDRIGVLRLRLAD
jgi:hypothetical protein